MALSLYYSFTRYELPAAPSFIGTGNYSSLFGDPTFYQSLRVTIVYALVSVPLNLVIGLLLAIMLNQRVFGMRLFRTLIYLPVVIPPVASTIVFKEMFDPSSYGMVNYLLMHVGISGTPLPFLSSPSTALPTLIAITMWSSGGSMLIWLAGLQSVPKSIYEASWVDGAGALRRFFAITIPLISPTILFNAVLAIIAAFQVFAQAMVLGGPTGSPLGSLDFIDVYIYRNAFVYLDMGRAAAAAWILFVLVLAVSLTVFRFGRRFVYYEGER